MHRLTIIKANGDRLSTDYHTSPVLDTLQKAVGGGLIETIAHFTMFEGRRCTAYCNEEGKLKNMPLNAHGMYLWSQQPRVKGQPIWDIIVGDIAIITKV